MQKPKGKLKLNVSMKLKEKLNKKKLLKMLVLLQFRTGLQKRRLWLPHRRPNQLVLQLLNSKN